MKIAILFRGFHKLNEKVSKHDRHFTSPTHFDYRECFFSFIKKIYEPLIQENHHIDLYVITYHSEIDESLKHLPNVKNILFMNRDSNQPKTFQKGLFSIPDTYDLYIVTRFDLFYKQEITRWLPILQTDTPHLCAPWREYAHHWNKDHRMSDVIYAMNTQAKIITQKLINELPSNKDILHTLYNPLTERGCIISFFSMGFYDSNPTYDARAECCNPFYTFWARPYHHFDTPDKI